MEEKAPGPSSSSSQPTGGNRCPAHPGRRCNRRTACKAPQDCEAEGPVLEWRQGMTEARRRQNLCWLLKNSSGKGEKSQSNLMGQPSGAEP